MIGERINKLEYFQPGIEKAVSDLTGDGARFHYRKDENGIKIGEYIGKGEPVIAVNGTIFLHVHDTSTLVVDRVPVTAGEVVADDMALKQKHANYNFQGLF